MFSLIVASQLRKGKFEATVLSDEADIYCRCTTPYILTDESTVDDAIQPESMVCDFGVKVVHDKAVSIDTDQQRVKTASGAWYPYDELVIATGASPAKPSIPGIDLDQVHTVRTSDDVRSIQSALTTAKSAIVIGAGIIGIEMAGAFRKQGLAVRLVEYAVSVSPYVADPEFADRLIGHLRASGVEVMFSSDVTEIRDGVDGKKEVTIQSEGKKRTYETDLVVVATGVRPNLDILQGTEIKADKRGILVDRKMRTSMPHIYACGDCCVPLSAIDGSHTSSQLASSAIQQSKIVGYQMAGFPIAYGGTTVACALRTLDREYACAGLTEVMARKKFRWVITGKAETTDVYRDLKTKQSLVVKLVFAGPRMRLVGYQAFGNGVIASAELASFAIGLRLSMLKMLRFNYIAHPSLTPWPFMNPIVMATEDALGTLMKKVKTFFHMGAH